MQKQGAVWEQENLLGHIVEAELFCLINKFLFPEECDAFYYFQGCFA